MVQRSVYYSMVSEKQNKEKENSMNELTCKVCDDVTKTCDEGVVAVTCSSCVNNAMMELCGVGDMDTEIVGVA